MSTNLAYLEITIAGTKVIFPSLQSSPRFIHAPSKKKKKKIGPTNSRFSPLFDFANVRWLNPIEIDGTRKKFVLPIWDEWHFSNLSRDLPQFEKNTLHSRRSCVYAYLWRVVFLLLHWSRLIMQNDDLLFVECVHKIKYFTESLWYSIYSEIASDFVMKVMDVMYKAKWIIRVTLFFFRREFFSKDEIHPQRFSTLSWLEYNFASGYFLQ